MSGATLYLQFRRETLHVSIRSDAYGNIGEVIMQVYMHFYLITRKFLYICTCFRVHVFGIYYTCATPHV